jgi:hypothetical protein
MRGTAPHPEGSGMSLEGGVLLPASEAGQSMVSQRSIRDTLVDPPSRSSRRRMELFDGAIDQPVQWP